MHGKTHRNALAPGYKLQWYEIKSVLGQGGFGITYLADDLNLHREVAIKEYLPSEFAVREGASSVHPISENRSGQYNWGLERFITEARILAKFKHPNIVPVQAVFEANNTGYMVMTFEQGESLQNKISGKKTLPEKELRDILFPILDGLQMMHEAGFIHRDLKPANIFIRTDGSPVLLDFGSARQAISEEDHTLTSMVSPGYAPYEQYSSRSDEQGPWTDIYGLAATLYRAVCGVAPPTAIDRSKAIVETGRDPYVPLAEIGIENYSNNLLVAVDHAMQFKSQDRPQTIAAWRSEFGSIEDSDTFSLRLSPADRRTRHGVELTSKKSRNDKLIISSIILFVILASGYLLHANKDVIGQYGDTLFGGLERDDMGKRETESSPAENQEDKRMAEIKQLLQAAEADFRDGRLLEPEGNNALEKYARVLTIELDNAEARHGRERIATHFINAAEEAVTARQFPRAETYLEQAEAVEPGLVRIQKVRARLMEMKTKLERLAVEEEKKQLEEQKLSLQRQQEEEKQRQLQLKRQEEEKLKQQEIDRLKEIERQREHLAAREDEKQYQQKLEQEAQYNRLLYQAHQLLNENQMDLAIARFQQAQTIIPDRLEAAMGIEQAQTLKENCQKVVGRWDWFNGGVTTFFPNGTAMGEHRILPGNDGKWECTDPRIPKFVLKWREGGWVNNLTLSADGKKLDGTNQRGTVVSGRRRER